MFTSAGFFRTIPCPFHLYGLCERVYCQFSHDRESQETHGDGPRAELKAASHNIDKDAPRHDTRRQGLGTNATAEKLVAVEPKRKAGPITPGLKAAPKRPAASGVDVKADTKRPRVAHAPADSAIKPSVPSTSSAKAPSVVDVKADTKRPRVAHAPTDSAIKPSVPSTSSAKAPSGVGVKADPKRTRVAHVPGDGAAKPFIPFTASAKVARKLRQQCVDALFGALVGIHGGDERAACAEAMRLEAETYKAAAAHNYTAKMRAVLVGLKRLAAGDAPSPAGTPGGACEAGANAAGEEELYQDIVRFGLVLTGEQLGEHGYPSLPDGQDPAPAVPFAALSTEEREAAYSAVRSCARCGSEFAMIDDAVCVFHTGRVRAEQGPNRERRAVYACCGRPQGSDGCTTRDFHVHEQAAAGQLAGYVRTRGGGPGARRVYALDCEMCYTLDGTELTRVTIVDWRGEAVYDALVRPGAPVLDYNTQYSGITAERLAGVTTTLADVQDECRRRFSAQSILIGHSLNSDLVALRLLHATVVDTSCVYPHPRPPHKYSLRHLAQTILGRFIQQDSGGHDSKEDAVAALDLVRAKVSECRQREVAQQHRALLQTRPPRPPQSTPRPPAQTARVSMPRTQPP